MFIGHAVNGRGQMKETDFRDDPFSRYSFSLWSVLKAFRTIMQQA